ncbi:BMC domain-containing protein [Vagococcus carniphilus]|uniref:BMC domain-containing protein n=1 Tax=Vagococcus carniphilus TaxID=218144 RepID=A0A430B6T6_9ENTE|nr:BMC domain-containing protein [Vagococcus carniphilus]MDT2814506.1 BMC domain-containing protein [Vagococcus carniphilus]MDT2830573.1 BMC domain-containing protein [Vagococcus carniphilus]MDT2835154.1 BMC domain-containing protein [Vagococcus carniphilus]MDT2839872.1 BMC domain-containing protein [Vagococcus carniphilus]MDT2849385.1 BMC domain-containing protein [Vagococcus carniphilus]
MEIDTLGFLELNSIAKGIEAVDYMLKVAECQLISAKASCPGKYYIIISGRVDAVTQSIEEGTRIGGMHIVGKLIIPRIDPQVVRAINMTHVPDNARAIGAIEYYSAAGSIVAADFAVKAASVDLISLQLATGIAGKSFVVLTGDVDAVKAAVEAGVEGAKDEAMIINHIVLPNPRKELIDSLVF